MMNISTPFKVMRHSQRLLAALATNSGSSSNAAAAAALLPTTGVYGRLFHAYTCSRTMDNNNNNNNENDDFGVEQEEEVAEDEGGAVDVNSDVHAFRLEQVKQELQLSDNQQAVATARQTYRTPGFTITNEEKADVTNGLVVKLLRMPRIFTRKDVQTFLFRDCGVTSHGNSSTPLDISRIAPIMSLRHNSVFTSDFMVRFENKDQIATVKELFAEGAQKAKTRFSTTTTLCAVQHINSVMEYTKLKNALWNANVLDNDNAARSILVSPVQDPSNLTRRESVHHLALREVLRHYSVLSNTACGNGRVVRFATEAEMHRAMRETQFGQALHFKHEHPRVTMRYCK